MHELASAIGKQLSAPGAGASGQAREAPATSSSTSFRGDEATAALVDYLFVCFNGHYGNAWSKRFLNSQEVEVAHREWTRRLSGLTKDQIADAWRRCGPAFPTFPPSPSEFRKLAVPDPVYALPTTRQLEHLPSANHRMKKFVEAMEQVPMAQLKGVIAKAKEYLDENRD